MDIFYPVQLFSDWVSYQFFRFEAGSAPAAAVNFFIYDTIKILILLAVIIYAVSLMRSFLPPEKVRALLVRKNKYFGNLLAALLGIPLYSNAAGIIPLVSALTEKGVAIGTVLAFMMAVTGLSLPEFVILRRVMKTKLILIFAGIVGLGIMFTGYLFNAIMQ